MKKIMQFRFEGANNPNNYPDFGEYYITMMTAGNLFNDYNSISHLGIQGPMGMKFYLNNGPYPITIGKTGIYELNLENIGRIHSIRFDQTDIDQYFPEENIEHHELLIDIVYEGGLG